MGKRRLNKNEIAQRIAQEIPDGATVNLGIGIPTLVAQYVPPGREVIVHSENGIVGMGPPAAPREVDTDIIDASKRPVTLVKGASIIDHATSFAIVRGGYLDLAVLGAFQVSQHGDIANWRVPGDAIPGVGGAMDLCSGAKRLVVAMTHTDSGGEPKIVPECTYPLTAKRKVSAIYTDLAVIDVCPDGLHLREIAPGWTAAEVQQLTGVPLRVRQPVPEISVAHAEAA
jgi:3-oxoadipate CoA-transferase, beta subunit